VTALGGVPGVWLSGWWGQRLSAMGDSGSKRGCAVSGAWASTTWSAFPPGYLARFQADTTDLSPAVWGRLRPVFNDPATVVEAELLDVVG